ncbi:unnamed protein product [Clonostachys rosea f. rosea IK726]|uniref:Uncharacterized protein n=2 Tax=Bionectria ochroleuca TaxID=29856 RepID=A0A0B7JPY7_BIOOC|nr:unnamed protein product [Clonostachys rosea f. rosea IK726]
MRILHRSGHPSTLLPGLAALILILSQLGLQVRAGPVGPGGMELVTTAERRRAEAEGADCSPEGQWNCMPRTWQRCADGKWTQVMNLSDGTICTPAGLTEEITIEHDGSVNGTDDGGSSQRTSDGTRNAVSRFLVLWVSAMLIRWRWS